MVSLDTSEGRPFSIKSFPLSTPAFSRGNISREKTHREGNRERSPKDLKKKKGKKRREIPKRTSKDEGMSQRAMKEKSHLYKLLCYIQVIRGDICKERQEMTFQENALVHLRVPRIDP